MYYLGFPGSSAGKESICNVNDLGLIAELGRFRGEGNPLQYSSLENSMDRETWQAIADGVTKSQRQLSDQQILHTINHWTLTRMSILFLK